MVLAIHQRNSVRFLLLLSLALGERDCELRPAFEPIRSSHASSVNPDNRLNESKSKPVPPRFASLNSSLEEVATNFRIEARAIVFHRKHGRVFVCAK
jgi:hypothetical protein